jgi:aspartate dehydrogenase
MTLKIGLAGLGAIGWPVAKRLDRGIAGLELVAVAVNDRARAAARFADFARPPTLVEPEALAGLADVVIEAVPKAVFRRVVAPAVARGRIVMPLSVGALLDHADLVDEARRTGARILVPTGALAGLDAVRAAAEGRLDEVRIVTRKPPGGLAGAPHLAALGLDMAAISTPTLVFDGSARDGARGFPANVNVAAALALAGIGPDRTRLQIWADPTVTRNTHEIHVDGDATRLTIRIEGVPDPENPRTGRLTPLSVIAALKRLVDPLVVGT